ncbi:hypothetical protein [Streptomyces johnsoniae]|uniref:Uncharacterized protein n=1 Tax=Streptomyces johnsoniae TaxID=3075532 RepID=A0ABU2S9D9_9ACTN|nr:hypothetical protein [Streptomyces sp. DSM 41886]MDT0445586.1 hypothetical protein [Streptomyces sp. DSM 41886]
MTARPALVVPVALDALVVNEALRRQDGFRIWRQNYLALDDFAGPEPGEGDRQSDDPVHSAPGVHLHWTLPRGLRHGVQDQDTGETTYPLVPNRWLVVRFSGATARRARAWVIESDCPHTPYALRAGHPVERSSPYLVSGDTLRAWRASADPHRNARTSNAHQVHIGLAFPHTDATPWTERAGRDPLFLTAMNTGNPYFATYAPHNSNVFSFFDDLSDIASADTLGYQVIGWYSDPDADILAARPPGTAYADQLAHLGWQDPRLTGDPAADAAVVPAARSLYNGLALTVPWDPAATAAPAPDPLHATRDSGALNVAVGTTTEDSFTALVGHALRAGGGEPSGSDMGLIRAFLHNLLTLADEKGGDARVRRSIHGAAFGASSGGHRWTVTPPPDDTPPDDTAGEGTAPRPFTPPSWLTTLNDDQHRLDRHLGELHALQWQLNALWLKNGLADVLFPPPDDAPDQELMQAELDQDRPGSLAHTVSAKTAEALALAAEVPQPASTGRHADAHDALLAGIDAFARARGLAGGARLKAMPAQPFWQSGNPVVSLSGVRPPADATVSDEPLPVRPLTDAAWPAAAAVTVGGTAVTATPGQGPVPVLPGLDALPAEVPRLLTEYFLLDPGNAPALAAATGLPADDIAATLAAHRPADYGWALPALGLDPWAQPWEPLVMEWKAAYHHIPHTVGGRRCWTFDGTDYRCAPGAAIDPEPVTIKGTSPLGPHPRALFAARLKEFVSHHGTAGHREQLDTWLTAIGDWGFLAQELTGFNDRLAARDTGAFRRPTPDDTDHPEIAGLAGYPDAATEDGLPARYRGRVTSVPALPGGESAPFHETRQGQIHLEQVFLYDKFGRVLDVVSPDPKYGGLHDYRSFPLVIDDALAPDTSFTPTVAAVAQLPPRPLQPARLDFDLLDGATGTRVVGTAADPSPIAGWLLPNHLDHSLLLYHPTGRLLGTYRLLTGTDGRRTGQWEPPPDGTLTTLDEVEALAPVIAGLLRSPGLATEANLTAFLDVIDSTLWTTDPLGRRADQDLSVLIGRPLALVPAQLRLTLQGPPIRDTGWAATLNPPPPAFTAHEFAVRLGDQPARDDGLVGFYRTAAGGGYDFDRFDSVTAPDDEQDYITRIGAPGAENAPQDANYLPLTFGDTAPTGLLLLLDPRAAVHATCGITPAVKATVPARHVDDALRRLQAAFRFGPVLTSEHGRTVTFPRPAEKHGTWSWLRPAPVPGPWTPYELIQALPDAPFQDRPTTLQDGLLGFLTEPEQ